MTDVLPEYFPLIRKMFDFRTVDKYDARGWSEAIFETKGLVLF